MDSKTKHRILGVLVVAGLIVILLPFLQTGKELSAVATAVKTPPFPDQSVQVTSVSPVTDMKQTPDDTIKTDQPVANVVSAPSIVNPVIDQKPKDITPVTTPAAPHEKEKISEITPMEEPAEPVVKKAVISHKHTVNKVKRIPYIHAPIDNNGLFKLTDAAWVIQVGSFKNKANALRVVNHLRANGYRAFIQQFSAAESTRVFVGPENRQASARELAQKLETDMHVRGIVISYKPLAL
jgi:DedD protein